MLETFYTLKGENETVNTLCLAPSSSGRFLGWWHSVETGLVTEKARRYFLKSGAKPRTGSAGAHVGSQPWDVEAGGHRSRQET